MVRGPKIIKELLQFHGYTDSSLVAFGEIYVVTVL